ncbi:hypothetical protein MaudMau93_004752 [Microsporum audouinii]
MHKRHPDGSLSPADAHPRQAVVNAETEEEQEALFQSGGAGLFGTIRDYSRILAALLNGRTSPTTGNRILSADTVESMFQNQVPDMPDFASQLLSANSGELQPSGWGLSFMMRAAIPMGRSANNAFWAGMANCFWWCDPVLHRLYINTSVNPPYGHSLGQTSPSLLLSLGFDG